MYLVKQNYGDLENIWTGRNEDLVQQNYGDFKIYGNGEIEL